LARAVLKILFFVMLLSKRNASGGFADKKRGAPAGGWGVKGGLVGANLENFLRPIDGNVFNIMI